MSLTGYEPRATLTTDGDDNRMAATTTVATIERYSGDREDWTVWHARFRGALDDVDLLEVADGTEVEPSAGGDAVVDTVTRKTDTKQGHWKRKNRKLFSALQRALDDDQMVTVTSAVADGDGKAAYDELVRLNKATTTASLNAILIQLLLLRADSDADVDRVLAKQQSLNTQLKTGKAGRELSDETMAALVFWRYHPRWMVLPTATWTLTSRGMLATR